METTRNRAAVLAKILRAAIAQLQRTKILDPDSEQYDSETKNGLEVIGAVAEELEEVAAAPEPVP
jgi:hypothetical protein